MNTTRYITVIVAGSVSAASACAQPLSHWSFDETSGAVAADPISGFVGSLRGDAAFAPGEGKAGGAVRITAAGGGHVTMGDVYMLTGGAKWCVSLWIKTADRSTQFPLSRHHTGVVAGFLIGIGSHGGGYGEADKPHLYIAHHPGGEARGTTVVTDDQWHQIVGMCDGSRPMIFVDGAPVEDEGTGAGGGVNAAPFLVGGLWNGSAVLPVFTGMIDDVQVYGNTMSDAAVDWLFANPGQVLPPCYADCDTSTGMWVLDIFDFLCFGNLFAVGDPYACDCDVTTGPLVCDIFDFLCFGNAFANGCR